MKRLLFASLAALAASTALAQAPPVPSGPQVISAQQLSALAAAARAAAPAGQTQANRALFGEGPYRGQVEHRIAGTPPSIHETAAELLVVTDGEGVATLGGELVDPVRRGATTMTGSAIRGGQARPVAKGDFVFVPKGVAHGFTDVRGTLVMVAVHFPLEGR